ncbi:MAG TPA: AI-2E family transporter [Mycetocola sp.]|uniref:AI-2E family transporter n=1 Tax=Mycetocola sp. TaxID=1871042 RepID=UPI00262EEAD9|nr:AI-2E family transporter [Mycetocola sp.]MCU1560129.1 family transporter [Mycetocola sp.]HEV7849572.1 AI-2E family transporter [Mycetocola sp.]
MAKTTEKNWWGRVFRPADSPVDDRAPASEIEDDVPRAMRIAGAWSWRLLVIAAALAVLIFLVVQLRLIVIPLFIGVLVSALLTPFIELLTRHRWPRGLAIATAILGTVAVVGGLLWLVIWQITREFSEVQQRTAVSFNELKTALLQSPLHLTETQINDFIRDMLATVQNDSQTLLSGALSLGSTLGHVATGLFLAIFCLVFVLIDGRGIWGWLVRLTPMKAQPAIDGAGKAGWFTLTNYARTQILVASIDAFGIGLGAFLLGVPLAIPIGVLVFLGSFVPIVGAVVTGIVAVFVALVYNGWFIALLMLGVVLLVQQIEGHVLQPLLMGAAVKVHPLAVVLVVAGGTLVAGIPGALFAVPVAAVINVMFRYIASGAWRTAGLPSPLVVGDAIWRTVPTERRALKPLQPRHAKTAPETKGTPNA